MLVSPSPEFNAGSAVRLPLETSDPSPASQDAHLEAIALGGMPSRRTSLLRGTAPPARHGHRIPASQYVALGVWLGLMAVLYLFTRAVCGLGVPADCAAFSDIAKILRDFESLLFQSIVLAVLTGVHWPDRFQYIFCFRRREPRGVLFLVTLFLSSLGWGLLGNVPVLDHFSLTPGALHGTYLILLATVVIGAAALIIWHLSVAFRYNSWSGFLAYSLSRLGLLAFYVAHIFVITKQQDVSFHFHHYVVGYLAATLAEFNHPFSLLLLSCGTGVYVQGIAAYGADPIVSDREVHLTFQGRDDKLWTSPLISEDAADFFIEHCRLWASFFVM